MVTHLQNKIISLGILIIYIFIVAFVIYCSHRDVKYDNRRRLLIYTIDLAIDKLKKKEIDDGEYKNISGDNTKYKVKTTRKQERIRKKKKNINN